MVVEIGGNHRGDLYTACRMVEIVAGYCLEHFDLTPSDAPRPIVKFQKRTPKLRPDDFKRPHPNPYFAYGNTYGEHREALEFCREDHYRLRTLCHRLNVGYAASVWDIPAADVVVSLKPTHIKIPSAHNLDFELLAYVYDQWHGSVHISLGMTARDETEKLAKFVRALDAMGRTVFYACTGAYPVAFPDVCLKELTWITETYGPELEAVGFSGHHHGIAVDVAAMALGARYIERHFTLDRTWRGTDHAASLEPDGLRKLIRDTRHVAQALDSKPLGGLLDAEREMRKKMKVV